MKKIFTLFAALAMVMSMSAAVYLPGSWNGWNASGNQFTGSPLKSELTLTANTTYEFKVLADGSWLGNNGTITSDVTDWSFTDAGNCKLKTTKSGVYTFTWNNSTKKLSVAYPTEEVVVEYTYTVVGGSAALFGNTWDPSYTANDMKKEGDVYTLTKTDVTLAAGPVEYKVAREHAWGTGEFPTSGNKTFTIETAGVYDVTFTYDGGSNLTATPTLKQAEEVIPVVSVKGSWDEWALKALTLADNKLTAAATINIAAGSYKFGVDIDGVFTANGATVSRQSNAIAGLTGNTGDLTLTADVAGDYVFTWTFETNTLTVTYPELPTYTVSVTAENGTVEGAGTYKQGATVTLEATANEGYEFVNWTEGETVVSTENPYTFTVSADVALVANFQEVAPAIVEMELTMTNLEVQSYGEATGLWASDDDNGVEVMLFLDAEGNLMEEESSIAVGWNDYAVTGTVTKVYNEELATDVYTAELYATIRETNYKLIITMYAVPVEVVDVVVENATITVEEKSDGVGGTYELINVFAQWGESTLLIEGIEKNFEGFVMITEKFMVDGEEDWYIWMGQNAVVTTVDNVLTVAGEFKNNFTGSIYNVTISGTLPVEEEPKTITWELNGGEVLAAVPTNEELWEAFKPYYNEYYGLNRADQTIENAATFAATYMQKIMTDEASAYKWLGDYIQSVATAAGKPLSTDMAAVNESGWRWSVWAFLNACEGKNGSSGIDFTEAGKPENWGPAYQAAHEVVLPTEPVEEDYVLPTPVKEGYTFVGWYDNAEGTGEAYTVIPAGWAGTLYAIWKQGPTTALENIAVEGKAVKAIINGQLVIIKNGVQYNAQGQVVK